mgnify:CR=1 FL=1
MTAPDWAPYMRKAAAIVLLGWLDPERKPVFVLLPEAEYRRLQYGWHLPRLPLSVPAPAFNELLPGSDPSFQLPTAAIPSALVTTLSPVIDPQTRQREWLRLAQADEAAYDDTGAKNDTPRTFSSICT